MAEKRKAGPAMSPNDSRSAKRQRTQNGEADLETPQKTTQQGLQFVQSLKQAKDKTGRPIATEFLSLPNPKQVPQYYEEIRLPVALDTIEGKLGRHEYATISELEGDVKRMVANAKFFNDKKSTVYEDAERIRKTASNWMTKNNPAYRNPAYVAQPTPIPGGLENGKTGSGGPVNGVSTPTPAPSTVRLTLTNKAKSNTPAAPASASTPAATAKGKELDGDFAGLTFQQAQDKLMSEMIKYVDEESGLEIFQPFVNLPPRHMKDYYELIKKPVSLKSVQKLANGIRGRNQAGGDTDFRSWDAFEDEVSYIWRNAREYNEDGSEMYNLAGEFQGIFKTRLAQAKAQVNEPHAPTLKLKMSAPTNPIKLKLHAGKESPVPQSARATSDGRSPPVVDQKPQPSAAVNGQGERPPSESGPRNPFTSSRSGSAVALPALNQKKLDVARSASAGSPPAVANGVKSESQPSSAAMPPPSGLTPRLHSSSPHPQVQGQPQPQPQPPPPPPPPLQHTQSGITQQLMTPANGFDKYRTNGKSSKDALLPTLTLQSHPQLNLPRPIRLTIPAHPRLTAQSATISLPTAHHFLQIVPHIPVALTSKPYRIFVNVNGRPALRLGTENDRTRPVFEGRLERGVVNRVEVEVLAAGETPRASSSSSGGGVGGAVGNAAGAGAKEKESVEWEKSTVFVHLPRV